MAHGRDTRIALALSGGGYRATLYALGVCMALVDRGLNRRVIQVSSVSGGSILNAVFAHHETCFAELTPDRFDDIAQDVASAVAYRPMLGRRWVAGYLGVMLICGAASGWAFSMSGLPSELWLVAVAVGAGVPLLWFGHFVTWRFRRSFFPRDHARTFGDLPESAVEHVFCASDLLTGYPVYVSTWHHGRLWRRTTDVGILGGKPATSGELWDGADLTLAEVVRASAGFPGIPPRRIRVGGRLRGGSMAKRVDRPLTFGGAITPDPGWDAGAVMMLSDGGVINNLGTQTLTEDRFFQGTAGIRPDAVLLSVNASARLSARRHWPYYVPGLSTVSQLRRCLELLYSNSVVPRVASARVALRRRAKAGTFDDPIDLVVDLSMPAKRLELFLAQDIVDEPDVLAQLNPQRKIGEKEMLGAVKSFLHEHRYDHASTDEKAELVDKLDRMWEALPSEVPQVSGVLDHRELRYLTDNALWESLIETDKVQPDAAVPTTLGSFRAEVVGALVLRGYLHGLLASLAIEPLTAEQTGRMGTRATERIRALTEPPHVHATHSEAKVMV